MTGGKQRSAFSAVADMEEDVTDVYRWAQVLYAMSGTSAAPEVQALGVIAASVEALGERLKAQWDQAFELLNGTP